MFRRFSDKNTCQHASKHVLQCQSLGEIDKHFQNTLKLTVCKAYPTGTNGCVSVVTLTDSLVTLIDSLVTLNDSLGCIHYSQYGTLDKQYASKCSVSVCQFYRMLDIYFDTEKHTWRHDDKCSVLEVFRTQPLVIKHLQAYRTGTNGCVSRSPLI